MDFFSLVPDDIHYEIVRSMHLAVVDEYNGGNEYFTPETELQAQMEYAKMSPLSHRLVLEAMKFRFAPWHCHSINMDWITCFEDDLQEIDFSITSVIIKARQPLPIFPKLRKASVNSSFHKLKLIRNMRVLENL